jgi:methionyl-tRNA synthetase
VSKYLITSALPYINGVKHLGNLAGSLLPADVYARFLRHEGEEVLFICATDEHGTPAELSAREAQRPVQEYCDAMYRKQSSIYAQFGLSFDHFGRTSSVQNRVLTQHFYEQLAAHGYLVERTVRQIYSSADGRFLPDRYVVGSCPKCGYQAARGDQCESCTAVLDPTDLVEPQSAISGSTDLEVQETDHLFLRLDVLSGPIRDWIEGHSDWSRLTRSIALKWLDEGLSERCITRDLDWGVSVPREGFEHKVFYVWFDAPIGYIGATKEWSDQAPHERDWQAWWWDAPDVTYTQFMAKDNVPFHTMFFPGMVLGTREPWTMPTQIKSFNWLTYYSGKFSTSQKRGIFLDDALALFPPDYWRYFLLANAPESDDTSFTWELFAQTVNKDLVGTFGNFVNRTLKLTEAHFGHRVPENGEPGDAEQRLQDDCQRLTVGYREHLRHQEFRKAMQVLRELWSTGNVYLDRRAPWNLLKTQREEAAVVLRTAIKLIAYFAMAAEPIMPSTAGVVLDALQVNDRERQKWLQTIDLASYAPIREFRVPELLFRRIDEAEIGALRKRFDDR